MLPASLMDSVTAPGPSLENVTRRSVSPFNAVLSAPGELMVTNWGIPNTVTRPGYIFVSTNSGVAVVYVGQKNQVPKPAPSASK